MNFYITGDTHGNFSPLLKKIDKANLGKGDCIIILGDSGLNYYLNDNDEFRKTLLNKTGVKFFCIRGNHEERPELVGDYILTDAFGGKVYTEKRFPNLLFAKDGEIYDFNNRKVIVIGGAYSIDKDIRLMRGWGLV